MPSKRSIVTVEEIVDDFGPRSLNAVILPAWTVGAIAVVPGGAFPSYAQGYYKRDNAFYKEWDGIARERDSFLAWMKENVLERGRRKISPRHVEALADGGGVSAMTCLHTQRDDDHRGGARAAQRETSASSASACRRRRPISRG